MGKCLPDVNSEARGLQFSLSLLLDYFINTLLLRAAKALASYFSMLRFTFTYTYTFLSFHYVHYVKLFCNAKS